VLFQAAPLAVRAAKRDENGDEFGTAREKRLKYRPRSMTDQYCRGVVAATFRPIIHD
jgi:hypothetical protein